MTVATSVIPPVPATAVEPAALQRLLDTAVARNRTYGGGVLRLQKLNGQVLWQGAAGMRRHGDHEAMRVDDAFEIASITKVFTAVVVMQLVEEGKIELDGPLAKVAPPHWVDTRITARHLLSHTSGLPDYWTDPPFVETNANAFLKAFNADPNRLWQPHELVACALQLEPVGAPGEKFHYCDTGYVILGMVIEHITQKPLGRVFQERIFAPLALTHTFLKHYDQPSPAGKSESHRYEDNLDLNVDKRQSADWAGGGIVSTTADLARFITALAAGKLFLNPHTLATMQTWRPVGEKDVSYGLGLYRIRFEDGGGELWGHDGHGNSFMYVWPEQELVVVGTLNQTANDWWPLVSKALDHV